ncbi:MAG TPA: tRNA 4-thiouridine(8) synthase ThiI [Spirochaetota bacterium]|nr:tRNA 4-thiouridine(8) synthase ThiI [Spirochaetota bacterium]
MGARGILLYSGGLDSLLAGRLLMGQGVEVRGIMFILPFHAPDFRPEEDRPAKIARDNGIPMRFFRCGREYMEMVKNPPHGYGKRSNPCIDCKIYFLRKAGELMESEGASFVATGEVVGQRPMSQMKHMLRHIENESGLKGLLLRPLSARLLPPTIAEREGLVDRERLLGISGRGRSAQMELARSMGITGYASPAGGCLFTDPQISRRVRDLLDNVPDFDMLDVYLLSIGRHFRAREGLKFIVGRNETENAKLEKYGSGADLLLLPAFKGPVVFARGAVGEGDIRLLASVAARYGKPAEGDDRIALLGRGSTVGEVPSGVPLDDAVLKQMMI